MPEWMLDALRAELRGWVLITYPNMLAEHEAAGRTHEFYRWTALWSCRDASQRITRMYTHGLNDDHIDSALRRILGDSYPEDDGIPALWRSQGFPLRQSSGSAPDVAKLQLALLQALVDEVGTKGILDMLEQLNAPDTSLGHPKATREVYEPPE